MNYSVAKCSNSPGVEVPHEKVHLEDVTRLAEVPLVEDTTRSRALLPNCQSWVRGRMNALDVQSDMPEKQETEKTSRTTHQVSRVIFDSAPIHMRTDRPVRPDKPKDRRVNAQCVQLPDCGRGRHPVLAVGII